MYDTIIIGRDLSSLIAALSSVHEGRKTVLVMEGDPMVVYREVGYAFPLDPRPLSVMADQHGLFRFLRDMLPVDDEISPDQPLDPAFQVILSGHRVDLFPNRERLINDLIREFPEQECEIKRFYRAVSQIDCLVKRWVIEDASGSQSFFKNILRGLVRLSAAVAGRSSLAIRSNGNVKAFKRVIDAQLKFLSHLDMDGGPYPLSAAYLLSLPIRGLCVPDGGNAAWMSRLRRAFIEHGGILKDGCSVIRVETEPDITVDIEREDSSSTLRGRKLIVSAQWEKLEFLLPGRKVLPASSRRVSSIYPVSYPFCLHIGVHEKGLPQSMSSYVVLVRDGSGTVTDCDLIFLQTSLPGDTDSAPAGRRSISAMVYLADSPLRLSDQELKDVAMGIIDSLDDFLPFLRDNIDYLSIEQSIFFSRKYQEVINRRYRTKKPLFIGIKTLSHRTRISNVVLTGGIIRAGLGLEGEIIAGMDAAFWAGQ